MAGSESSINKTERSESIRCRAKAVAQPAGPPPAMITGTKLDVILITARQRQSYRHILAERP